MESNKRTLWIFVSVVVIGMLLCVAAVIAAGLGAIVLPKVNLGVETGAGARIERSFELGASPALEIDNFAGGVAVRAGEGNSIQVVAVKKGLSASTRDRIQVEMTEREGGLLVKTQKPSGLSVGSVDLEITAPAGTSLRLHTGSGGVEVEGLTGKVTIDTGSGGIEVRDVPAVTEASTGSGGIDIEGAAGPVNLHTGSGGIEYKGTPEGECRFQTGSGSIKLVLPGDPNVKVDLSTGSGSIQVGYDVAGRVSTHKVEGTIGTGEQGSIWAQTGSGGIELKPE